MDNKELLWRELADHHSKRGEEQLAKELLTFCEAKQSACTLDIGMCRSNGNEYKVGLYIYKLFILT